MPERQVRWTVDYRKNEWSPWRRDPALHKSIGSAKSFWYQKLCEGNARIVKLVTTEEVVK